MDAKERISGGEWHSVTEIGVVLAGSLVVVGGGSWVVRCWGLCIGACNVHATPHKQGGGVRCTDSGVLMLGHRVESHWQDGESGSVRRVSTLSFWE
jgi:hypothetical protein